MKNFVIGCLFGIAVATIGFAGIVSAVDSGVTKTKQFLEESVNK